MMASQPNGAGYFWAWEESRSIRDFAQVEFRSLVSFFERKHFAIATN
jgi:hypothetical protein